MGLRKRTAAVLVIGICGALAGWTQDLDRERNFLVKLRTPIGSSISRSGSRVWASVISPETFLGAPMEGSVDRVSAGKDGTIRLTFRSFQHKGRTVRISSVITDFVNSKGHKLVDDEERPVRIDNGTLVTTGSPLWIDEGAELKLRVSPQP